MLDCTTEGTSTNHPTATAGTGAGAATTLRVPFHRVPINDDDVTAVADAMRSGWITTGAVVANFEAEFARRLDVNHAVAVNSGTAAMHLALEALGVGPGDEVLVPAYTFTATAEVVTYLGARPVLTDVDPASLDVTLEHLEAHRTRFTRAVMPVHVAGVGCTMQPIVEWAAQYGIAVVEDAAHAPPTVCDAGLAGTIGDAGAFSFYATKTMTTGEGGMLVTRRDDLAPRARRMALHGISDDAYDRYRSAGRWYYEVEDFGFKYNLTDMAAALGLSQLRRLDSLWRQRCAIADAYDTTFSAMDSLEIPYRRGQERDSWHLYLIRLHLDRLDCGRDEFVAELTEAGIGTSVHFIPLHLHPVYQRTLGYRRGDFPNAESQYLRLISLPIWPGMSGDDIAAVADAVVAVARRHAR